MKKIMIIDDSKTLLLLYENILAGNFSLKAVADSAEIIYSDIAEVYKPDLFIIDINMPNYDGFEVLEEIKKRDEHRAAKILMCSTKFFDQDRNKAKGLGADDFLFKPFKREELLLKVKNLLGE